MNLFIQNSSEFQKKCHSITPKYMQNMQNICKKKCKNFIY